MIHIGDNVRIARKRKGLTQEELAGQIGVTSQAVSRWESGAGLPDISLIVPIAQVLSVSTDMLFGLDNEGEDNQLLIQITNKYQKKQSVKRRYAGDSFLQSKDVGRKNPLCACLDLYS